MKKYRGFLFAILFITLLPSCRLLYPSLMFRQKDYQFFELAQKQIDQYVIQPGDELSVRLYTRDGFKLIDVLTAATSNSSTGTSSNSNFNSNNAITYLVDQEGFVRLPILGEMFVKGYTEKELQRVLAEKFSALFVDPFIITKVTNRRALVFRGGTGSVVSLNDAPTSLLEVIAKAGGLTQESKAYKIKVIRGDLKNPQVMLIDLSTLEGVRKADLIVQSNDIIYIEERRQNAAAVILSEISPYLGLVSTIATLVILVKAFGK